MDALESTLAYLSIFDQLRPDEVARIARRFERRFLEKGACLTQSPTPAEQRLVVVVSGRLELAVESRGQTLRSTLVGGDRFGDLALLSGVARAATLTATEAAQVGMLDRAGLEAIIAEFPAVAVPLAAELSREVSFTNDLVRQLLEVWAERLSPEQHLAAVQERRGMLERRGAKVSRQSSRALFKRAVADRGREPPFWATVGFILAVAGARLVVALILKYNLQEQLFALVPGADPNPVHIHHFNYGLILVGIAGLAALFPSGRKALRLIAFLLGVGLGLVFDEFALFWNLDPDYNQTLSIYSMVLVLVLLVNLTWFRELWVALARRAWLQLRGAQ